MLKASRAKLPGSGSMARMRAMRAVAATNSENSPTLAPMSTNTKAGRSDPRDLAGKLFPLRRLVHLRREQQVLLAAIVAGVQPHAQPPPLDVERGRGLHPHHHQPAQRHRQLEAGPVVGHPAGQRHDRPSKGFGRAPRTARRSCGFPWFCPLAVGLLQRLAPVDALFRLAPAVRPLTFGKRGAGARNSEGLQ